MKFPIKRRLISDVDLHLKLTKRGQVKRNDKEKQTILSRLYFEKKEELLLELKEVQLKPMSDTFESLFDLWIKNARSLKRSERTIKDHYDQVKRIWLEVFPSKRLYEFEKKDLITLREYLLEVYNKESSINSRIKTFRAFFSFLYDIEKLDRPVKFEKVSEDDKEPEILTLDQIKKLYKTLLGKLDNKKYDRYGNHIKALIRFIWLDYFTGTRRNEILYAKMDNFLIKERIWIIEKSDLFSIKEKKGGKKKTKKVIPLSKSFIKFFKSDSKRKDEFYIGDHPDGGKPIYSETGLSHALRREMDDLGFPADVKPAHFYRAKLPSDLINEHSVPLEIASKILDHSSIEVTDKHYWKKHFGVLLEAVDKVEGFDENGSFLEVSNKKIKKSK